MLASYFSNIARADDIAAYKGLGFKKPLASVSFVVVLISLTGLPVTAGFTGKLFVFSAIYNHYSQTGEVLPLLMMITGAVTTVVALFYYIKIPLYLFLRKAEPNMVLKPSDTRILWVSAAVAVLLLVLGVLPNWLYNIL